jgi:hypothetical protein
MPVIQVVSDKGQEWQECKLHRYLHKPAVPGDEGEREDRCGECNRERKFSQGLSERGIERELEQGDDDKPADDRYDLLFRSQAAYPLRVLSSTPP